MCTRLSNNYRPALRERAIRMVGEVRPEYTADWAACQSVATKLGIGAPQPLMKWVRKAQVDAGQRPGVTQRGGCRAAPAACRGQAGAHRERDITDGERVFRRGGARPPTGLIMAYIDAHREVYGVVPICRVLPEHGIPIAPSTYYDARRRTAAAPTPAQRRDEELCHHIRRVHAENFGVYGARKVWLQLNREGIAVARCTVERLMKQRGLQGVRRGKGKRTTIADPAATRPRDLVGRRFGPAAPNVLWVADIPTNPPQRGRPPKTS